MKSSERIKKPITVMFLIDTYISSPDKLSVGGTEKQLYLLVSSLNPDLFKSIVVQLSPYNPLSCPTYKEGFIEFFNFPTKKFYSLHGLRQLYRLSRLAKQYKVGVIHTFFEKAEVMGWLTMRFADIPIWITSRRDLGFKRKEIYKRIFRLAARDCRKCVANCYAVKQQIIQNERFSGEKVEVIYNGLDLSTFEETSFNRKGIRKELGLQDHVPLVGMIANFNFEIKGHGFFIGAAKKVLEKVSDVEFLLIGDGYLQNRYKEMAQALGVGKKIHFLGKRNDIPTILSDLTISVLSSTSEGLSNVILESMAVGKPMVATNVGGSPEIVMDGITGYLVPPSNTQAMATAIIQLLQDPNKAITMGAAGQKLVREKFGTRAMVESYENLYKSLITEEQQHCNS
jgi:glycosyltransferase involved in cell wall biosynthesis